VTTTDQTRDPIIFEKPYLRNGARWTHGHHGPRTGIVYPYPWSKFPSNSRWVAAGVDGMGNGERIFSALADYWGSVMSSPAASGAKPRRKKTNLMRSKQNTSACKIS